MNAQKTVTLTVTGQRYERWEEINVTREIDRCAATSTSPYPNGSWQGRLVLTRAGNDRAHDALLQGLGGDVQWASAVISGARRFSPYKDKAQQTVHGDHVASVELERRCVGGLGARADQWRGR